MKVSVLTRSYNNARTGANTQETVLTPDQVRTRGLRRLFSMKVTDDARGVEAQPLIVPDVEINSTKHDVVYLCTMANSIWAFDANTGQQLWQQPVSLGTTIKGSKEIDIWQINDHWGILSTPVIDAEGKTLYAVSWTSPNTSHKNAFFQLHALNLFDGQAKHLPLKIEASVSLNGKVVRFNPSGQKQRSALLLTTMPGSNGQGHKTLFMACGSVGETEDGAHGWVLAFDLATFTLSGAFCTSPSGKYGGGIWQAGQGPACDEHGHIYAMTGNGHWDGVTDFSESMIKLRYDPSKQQLSERLTIVDWFTPFTDQSRKPTQTNHRGYDWTDQDLGSGGAVLLNSLGLVIGAGKDGIIYVADRNSLGKTSGADLQHPTTNYSKLKSRPVYFTYFPGFDKDPAPDDPFELNFNFANRTHHLHGTPVFWESPELGPILFCWGENENLRAWNINAAGELTYLACGSEVASGGGPLDSGFGGMPGGMLCLSANGNKPHTGLVWTLAPINGDANRHVVAGILRVYDAVQFDTNPDGSKRMRLLWDSQHFGVVINFSHNKFNVPVVANGKVYVSTYDGTVDVYGLN